MDPTIASILQSYFRGRPPVAAAYLFGSQAQGQARPGSDVDVAVLLDADHHSRPEELRLTFMVELARSLRRDVHIVVLNTAGGELLRQVFSKGICLVNNNSAFVSRFKTTRFAMLADFGYYTRNLQRGFERRLKEAAMRG
jgi:predicted nucleotidyltransferase